MRFFELNLHPINKFWLLIAFCALGLTLLTGVGCSAPRSVARDYEAPVDRTTFSFDQGTYPSNLDLFAKYRVSPGDVLDVLFQIQRQQVDNFPITLYHTVSVKFVNLPNLNETQQVLPNGNIALPYLGEFRVVDKTPDQLRKELTEKYSNILRDPELYVTIPEFNERVKQLRNDLHTSPRGLSKLITVRPDGYVTFPLIGEIGEHLVAQKTIGDITDIIEEKYSNYLPGMKVDLFLHEQSGSVIYLVGEVRSSGAYEIRQPVTILQALSLAGGYTPNAELRNVVVFRQHEKKRMARSLNLKEVVKVERDSSFFYLRPNDIVYVPKTRIANLAQLMQQISQIALFRGWSYGLGEEVDWIGPNREDEN